MKIKTWQERQTEQVIYECTMNCGPSLGDIQFKKNHKDCEDCCPAKVMRPNMVDARDEEIAELRARIKELERTEREPVKRSGVTDEQIKDMFKPSLAGVTPLHCTYHLPDQELVFAVRKLFKMAQQKRK